MEEGFKMIIEDLLKHELTKKDAISKLLFLCNKNSSVKVGDRVRIDGYEEFGVKVLKVCNNKALCKLNNNLKKWYDLHRVIRL